MTRTKYHFSALAICLLFLLNSCGVLTPMRYNRGFKSNLELNFSKKEKKADRIVAAKAVKKSHPKKTEDKVVTIAEGQSYAIGNENVEKKSTEKTTYSKANQKDWNASTVANVVNSQIIKDSLPPKPEKLPYEPHVKWAGILFFGGLILSYFLPFVGIATIIGFFLALKGRRLIDESEGEFRGRGMANTIIIIVAIGAILTIITVALVIAILFA